jgi:hypothetical protein
VKKHWPKMRKLNKQNKQKHSQQGLWQSEN